MGKSEGIKGETMSKIHALILAAAFSTLLGGGVFAEDVVTLKMIAPWADKELEGFKPVLARFEQLNPGIKVEYRTGKPEDTATQLSTQFSVKKTPADIIDTAWPWYIAQEGAKGNLLALDTAVTPSDFRPGSLDQLTVRGKVYGVPSIGGLDIAEFNASLYKKNGLADPRSVKSWSELLDLLKKVGALKGVKAPIGTGGGVGWTNTTVVQIWLLTFGNKDLYNDLISGKAKWTDPQVKDIFSKFLLPLLSNKTFGEPEENAAVTQGMWDGKYGMFMGGTTDSLRFNNPPGDYAVTLLPGQKAVSMWSDFWFVPAYTQHPKEALKLLQFLSSEGQAIQVKGGGRIATNLKVPVSAYPAQEQMILKVLGSVAVVPDIDDTIGGKFQTIMWDQLKLLWAKPTDTTLTSVLTAMEAAAVETRAAAK